MDRFLQFLSEMEKKDIFEDIDDEENVETMRPTVEWMEEKFDELNKEYFDGELSKCEFEVFTKGKGSKGAIIGLFSFKADDFFKDANTGRLYKENGRKKPIFANKDNLVELGRPVIKLNGNFEAPEESWLETFLHEMVHYWNVKDGIDPKISHGKEFQDGCRMVDRKSNGRFKIKRLVDADKLNFRLDDEIAYRQYLSDLRRRKTIEENKKVYFIFLKNGNVGVMMVNTKKLQDGFVEWAKEYFGKNLSFIAVSDDKWLIKDLKNRVKPNNTSYDNIFKLNPDERKMVYDYDHQFIYRA